MSSDAIQRLRAAYSQGNHAYNQGDRQAALRHWSRAIEIGEALRPDPQQHPEEHARWLAQYGNDLARVYNNRGGLLQALGDSTGARADYAAALAIGEALRPDPQQHPEEHARWLVHYGNDLASVYSNHGVLLKALGDPTGAWTNYETAVEIHEALPKGVFIEHDLDEFRLYANMAGLLYTLEQPHVWAREASQKLAYGLEFDAPILATVHPAITEKRAHYARFHLTWLRFALARGELEVVPTIISAIQGRKLAQLLLDELDRSHLDPRAPAEVKRLKEIRQLLHDKTREIQQCVGSETSPSASTGGRAFLFGDTPNPRGADRLEHQLKLEGDYRILQQEYYTVRTAVAQYPDYAHLSAPYQTITATELRAGLEQQHILVLWIALPNLHGLLLIGQNPAPSWHVLPDPQVLVDGLGLLGQVLNHTRGYRTGPTDTTRSDGKPTTLDEWDQTLAQNPAHPVLQTFWSSETPFSATPNWQATFAQGFWSKAAAQLDALLWTPLKQALQGGLDDRTQLTFVTVGISHLLPLELSEAGLPVPPERIRHFPGLLFYRHYHQHWVEGKRQEINLPSRPAWGLYGFDGGAIDNRLFMVKPECQAIATYWRDQQKTVYQDLDHVMGQAPAQRGQISCHGGSDPYYPWSTALLVKEGEWFGMQAAFRNPNPPWEMILAACVALLTREDPDGDPFSIGSALMLRNTRALIGAIQPVPDQWMPILMLLLHQALGAGAPTLNDALHKAKTRLRQGKEAWFPDTEQRLRAVLPRAVRQQWNEQSMVWLKDYFPLRAPMAFLCLPSKAERRALVDHLTALLPGQQPQAKAALDTWIRDHGLEALAQSLQTLLVNQQGRDCAFVMNRTIADWGIDGRPNRLALHQAQEAHRQVLIANGASGPEATRNARKYAKAMFRKTLVSLSERAIDNTILQSGIPPEPDLGILLYGVRIYGQGSA